jgi:uncharacterized protein (DUF58 family)
VTPTTRAAAVLGVVAVLAFVLPLAVTIALLGAAVIATIVDIRLARVAPRMRRTAPHVLARGRPGALVIDAESRRPGGAVVVRQASATGVAVEPETGTPTLHATVTASRRGRHELPPASARVVGPLGLGGWLFDGKEPAEVRVYPDLPSAHRIARAVRAGRFRESGRHARGPLGLGTDLESVREYLPDDDIRQVNWTATARLGRPMSNQYRVEQDRDVIALVDTGRLMGVPIGDRTRLDAAVDAAVALATVADAVGDRSGVVAFDAEIRRAVRPGRAGGDAVVTALFDLEPRSLDSDYDLAFRTVDVGKRSLVVVLTDVVDAAAAASLLDAVPVLVRRHAVVVASALDVGVHDATVRAPSQVRDVYRAAAAFPLVAAKRSVYHRLRRAGAEVVEAPPERLGEACVASYLRLKARGRL